MKLKYYLPFLGLSAFSQFLRILPWPVISLLSSSLAFVMLRLIGYRKRTAFENLRRSFPERSEQELKQMLPKVYRNMTDVLLETVRFFYASREDILRQFTMPDRNTLEKLFENYRGAIMVSAHLSNWELCGFCFVPAVPTGGGIVAYRPIKNPYIDRLVLDHRKKSLMQIASMKELMRVISRSMDEPQFILLIADQSPDPNGALWIDFLNQTTGFFRGPGVFAHRYDLPVYFAYARRLKRHFYEFVVEPLCMDPKETTADEIMARYVHRLDAVIAEDPPAWLWTHKRWKHRPPVADAG